MYRPPRFAPASRTKPSALALAAGLLFTLATSAAAQDAGGHAELPRFGRVSERLSRGAQPREGGLRRLAELGFDTVINLRGASARTRSEEAEAAALGLRYFNTPLPAWGRPEDDRVRRVLEIISAPESGRVFVHCKDGVDRTGTVVALYRVTAEGWTAEAATEEAKARGMRRTQIWMRDYIGDYHERWLRGKAAGAPPGEGDGRDLGDRLGSYARTGERAAFKARKTAGSVLRRTPGAAGAFLDRVF
jgi:protein tyrosine phosphatase (PTP) superfamily phosphohydrolase (DUF442 family)